MEDTNNTEQLENLKNNQDSGSGWGGKREGAGRPKGSISEEKRIEQEAIRQFKLRVANRVDKLFNAQVSVAEGVQVLIRKEPVLDESGKIKRYQHVVVQDDEEICHVLDEGLGEVDGAYYYLTKKSPDNKALDSLLDRAFGRPQQYVDHTTGGDRIDGIKVEIVNPRDNDTESETN